MENYNRKKKHKTNTSNPFSYKVMHLLKNIEKMIEDNAIFLTM